MIWNTPDLVITGCMPGRALCAVLEHEAEYEAGTAEALGTAAGVRDRNKANELFEELMRRPAPAPAAKPQTGLDRDRDGAERAAQEADTPTIAEAMKSLGFMQRFAIGIEVARKRLAENNNPPPAFDVQDAFVLVTVRRRP